MKINFLQNDLKVIVLQLNLYVNVRNYIICITHEVHEK